MMSGDKVGALVKLLETDAEVSELLGDALRARRRRALAHALAETGISWRVRALLVALTFVVALLTTSNAGAVATPAPAAPTGVTVVKTGMYLNQIHEMNLKENFVVDLYVWFRWKGDAKPNESFSFIDGRIDSKTETGNRTLPDGSNYFRIAWS